MEVVLQMLHLYSPTLTSNPSTKTSHCLHSQIYRDLGAAEEHHRHKLVALGPIMDVAW